MTQGQNVTISVFDVDVLRYVYPEWDALTKDERYVLLRNYAPRYQIATSNVTCVELHEWLAQSINPEITINGGASNLLVGDDDSAFSVSDTSLNNETGSIDITDSSYDQSVPESIFTTFIDSTEQNGVTLRECGIESEDGKFMNHAAISPEVVKTTSKTVIIEVNIGFSN